eukprot:3324946-Rhodomonas_salina.1
MRTLRSKALGNLRKVKAWVQGSVFGGRVGRCWERGLAADRVILRPNLSAILRIVLTVCQASLFFIRHSEDTRSRNLRSGGVGGGVRRGEERERRRLKESVIASVKILSVKAWSRAEEMKGVRALRVRSEWSRSCRRWRSSA